MIERSTFAHLRMEVATTNIQRLEHKARAASALAATYPENADGFRAIESRALEQVMRILVYEPTSADGRNAFRAVPPSEIAEVVLAAD